MTGFIAPATALGNPARPFEGSRGEPGTVARGRPLSIPPRWSLVGGRRREFGVKMQVEKKAQLTTGGSELKETKKELRRDPCWRRKREMGL